MSIRESIRSLQKFTETCRKFDVSDKHARELACLKQQIPDSLLDPEEGDLFAGRCITPAVGFTPQEYETMGGIGYYINLSKIDKIRRNGRLNSRELEVLDELAEYWRNENTSAKIRQAYPEKMKAALPGDRWTEDSGPAFPLYRLAGSMLNYRPLLKLGIGGLRELIQSKLRENGENTFYQAELGILDLFADACVYYADRIRFKMKNGSSYWIENGPVMIETLTSAASEKPRTFRQAIQLVFLYNTLSGSLNYGRMDDYLGGFLKDDLDKGRISQEEAESCMESLWRLMIARNTPTDGRVIIGGRGRKNEKAADSFAGLAIRTSMKVRSILPQLSLRFYEGQNKELMELALESISTGNTFPILYNDDVNIPAVEEAFQITETEAEQYVPYGCGEYVIEGKSIGTPSGVINLLKVLEITLFNGLDIVSGRKTGIETGRFNEMKSFDQLANAYKRQTEYYVEILAEQEALEYEIAGGQASFLFLSLLYDHCIERGQALLDGGAAYLGGTLETYGNANTSDSLLAIKKLVFEEKKILPDQLTEMIKSDFQGFEDERHWLLNIPKYGNDDDEADNMYLFVNDHVCGSIKSMADKSLHSYLAVNINNSANTILGRKTAASADGRKAFTSMANGNAAAPGMDKNGLTAYLNSIVKFKPHMHAGYVQNIKLAPDLFRRHPEKLRALLRAYFKMGGTQLMINVISNDDLTRAMDHPEEFPNLIVRVGGFSAHFVDLERDVQLEIIRRTVY